MDILATIADFGVGKTIAALAFVVFVIYMFVGGKSSTGGGSNSETGASNSKETKE